MYNVYNMVRTQIYLPEELHQNLLFLARSEHLTLSELIRKGAKKIIKEKSRKDQSWKLMDKLAKWNLKGLPKDLSKNHDKYLAEAVLGGR